MNTPGETMRSLFAMALCLSLSACVTVVARDELAKPKHAEAIVLTEGFSDVTTLGLTSKTIETGANPGVYPAIGEDSKGTYYFAGEKTLWQQRETRPRIFFTGGIYVPRDRSHDVRFFIVNPIPANAANDSNAGKGVDTIAQNRIVQGAAAPGMAPGIGANVGGNILGGLIVAALIPNDAGKIQHYYVIENAETKAKILSAIQPIDASKVRELSGK